MKWKILSGGARASHYLGRSFGNVAAVCAVLTAATCQVTAAKTLCVNTGGTSGCYATIGSAVSAAAPGDTITVAHGVYKEDVTITKALSLTTGEQDGAAFIDATGKTNGITINGAKDVLVSGFTVENADAAGIWITSSSFVTISGNRVLNNDKALITGANPSCPALKGTPFEAGEAEDCGEGIFLSAVDHSTLVNNTVTGNAGGILMADDTGATHDNLVIGNSVVRNTQADCGITLPSHSPAGVYRNTIIGNDSSFNGGPGVGIFAPAPGRKAFGNVVANNRLVGNALPGVTMHNHAAPGVNGVPSVAPPVVFDDNQILGNFIAANSQDFEDAATAGPTGINIFSLAPMSGTLIVENIIDHEAIDIAIKIPPLANGSTAVQIHLNRIQGGAIGVQDSNATTAVDATQNWWGCSKGPGAPGCTTVTGAGVLFTPWLINPSGIPPANPLNQ